MNSKIAILNESDFFVGEETLSLLEGAIVHTLLTEEVPVCCEVSVVLCENEEIHALNLQYRDKDRPTDVLSFPIYESIGELMEDAAANSLAEFFALGDVVIAPRVVLEASEEIGDAFEKHLCRMCIHSVLHLLGFDHETSPQDEEQMLAKQESILEEFWKESHKCQK